jgi:hypothetical protein
MTRISHDLQSDVSDNSHAKRRRLAGLMQQQLDVFAKKWNLEPVLLKHLGFWYHEGKYFMGSTEVAHGVIVNYP